MQVERRVPAWRFTPEKYAVMRAAILEHLTADERGMAWEALVVAVALDVPPCLFPHHGSVRWYCKAVQLDLEERGEIRRIPGAKPLRLQRLVTPGR